MFAHNFDHQAFDQLKGKIPDQVFDDLSTRVDEERKNISFPNNAYLVNIDCRVGEKLEENVDEIFLPMIVNRFID